MVYTHMHSYGFHSSIVWNYCFDLFPWKQDYLQHILFQCISGLDHTDVLYPWGVGCGLPMRGGVCSTHGGWGVVYPWGVGCGLPMGGGVWSTHRGWGVVYP